MSPAFKSQIISVADVPTGDTKLTSGVWGEQEPPVVMVVDDEPLVTDTLAAILVRAGYKTIRAYDGHTALRLASISRPALLISDVAMPEMNGVQLAMAMAEMVPSCKVLLFSGHATRGDLAAAQAAGYDFPLLAKPVPPVEMLAQVSRCLSAAVEKTVHPAAFGAGKVGLGMLESA